MALTVDIVSLVYETAGVEAASTGPVPPFPRSSEISLVPSPSTIHGLAACQLTRAPAGASGSHLPRTTTVLDRLDHRRITKRTLGSQASGELADRSARSSPRSPEIEWPLTRFHCGRARIPNCSVPGRWARSRATSENMRNALLQSSPLCQQD